MRHRMAFLFLLALAVMTIAAPLQADEHHRRHHGFRLSNILPRVEVYTSSHYGYPGEARLLMEENANMTDGFVEDYNRRTCARHRGDGSSVELSTCYGLVDDGFGNIVDRNPFAVANQRGYRGYNRGFVPPFALELGYGRPDYNPANCVGKVFKEAKKYGQTVTAQQAMAMCTGRPIPKGPTANDKDKEKAAPPQSPASAPAAPTVVQSRAVKLSNHTGACLFINGQRTEPGATVTVWDDQVKVATLAGSSCRVVTETVSDAEYNLVCASK